MKLFIVTKEGVYRHEIYGIYDTSNLAIQRAFQVCRAEKDDYHKFSILRFDLNKAEDEDGELYATVERHKDVVSLVSNKQK